MGEWVELGDGHRAYRAAPPDGAGPGVLLLHAWWGLNDTFQGLTDRLAEAGFLVVAPDLYEGVVVDTVEEAEREVERIPLTERTGPVDAAVASLLAETTQQGASIGAVGFSLGAFYALEAAASESALRAVVLFYGTGQALDWSGSQASFLGHYAEDDPFEDATWVAEHAEAIRGAGRSFESHVYPGTGHWFMEPDRDAYDAAAASLAWDRTIDFLRRTLALGT